MWKTFHAENKNGRLSSLASTASHSHGGVSSNVEITYFLLSFISSSSVWGETRDGANLNHRSDRCHDNKMRRRKAVAIDASEKWIRVGVGRGWGQHKKYRFLKDRYRSIHLGGERIRVESRSI